MPLRGYYLPMEERATELRINSSYSRIIARMLHLQERELPALLAGTGLAAEILLPGDETYLNDEQQIQILANGHRLMHQPGFGLALGQQLGPASHGPIGYLSLSSPDLESALSAFADFLPARLPLISLDITVSGEWLECGYHIRARAPDYIRQSMEESFAVSLQSVVEAILRREAREAEVAFSHSRPDYVGRYAEMLHGSYRFESDRVYYRLPAALARVANSAGDSEAFRLTRNLCSKLLEQQPVAARSVSDRVRTLLLSQPQGVVSEEQIAKAMFVSRRTLARRLEQEGSGYREIRAAVLGELARQSLRQTSQSVESIAASLGYHDSAAFRKAFKRWTGITPQAYRARSTISNRAALAAAVK